MRAPRLARAIATTLATATLLISHPRLAAAQDPLSAVAGATTVSAVIGKLGDQLNQAIANAREAGRAVAIEAGLQANYSILNFQAVYQSSMNETVDRLDATARQQLGAIAKLVNDVATKADADLADAGSRAQQIVNTLPFRNGEPQLRGSTPRFVAAGSGEFPVSVEFLGNFVSAAEPELAPTLYVDGVRVPLAANTTQALTFSVPVTLLRESDPRATLGKGTIGAKPVESGRKFLALIPISRVVRAGERAAVLANGSAPRDAATLLAMNTLHEPASLGLKFGLSRAVLRVPWEESRYWGLWHVRHEHVYRVLLGRLPEVPGRITITRLFERDVVDQRPIEFNSGQRSDQHGGNEDHKDVRYELKPEPGCTIVLGSSSFSVASAGGDWSQARVSENAAGVVWSVTTIYHRFGASGHVDFGIHATEACPRKALDQVVDVWNDPAQSGGAPDLRWGEQRTLPLASVKSFTVRLDSFDGKRFETASPGMLGAFVRVDVTGSLELRASDPRTLAWP